MITSVYELLLSVQLERMDNELEFYFYFLFSWKCLRIENFFFYLSYLKCLLDKSLYLFICIVWLIWVTIVCVNLFFFFFRPTGPINELQEFIVCFLLWPSVCVSIYGANLQRAESAPALLRPLSYSFMRPVSHGRAPLPGSVRLSSFRTSHLTGTLTHSYSTIAPRQKRMNC